MIQSHTIYILIDMIFVGFNWFGWDTLRDEADDFCGNTIPGHVVNRLPNSASLR
jgi:hypothetical protein